MRSLPGARPVVVTIDLHRGHLDPSVATMPLGADVAARVTAANRRFLDEARARGVPVVHVVTRYRHPDEALANPFWAQLDGTTASRSSVATHQVDPTPGTQLMPGLHDPSRDVVVDTKKRYDCFLGTDLGMVLGFLQADTLLITGVNTNSCVLTTTAVASTRDYAAVVVSDCVDSMDGPDLHAAGLACIERAFGWVVPSDQLLELLDDSPDPMPRA